MKKMFLKLLLFHQWNRVQEKLEMINIYIILISNFPDSEFPCLHDKWMRWNFYLTIFCRSVPTHFYFFYSICMYTGTKAHIIGSVSWPKKKNFWYHLSGVVVDLLEVRFLPLGKKTIQPFSRAGGIQAKWPAKKGRMGCVS